MVYLYWTLTPIGQNLDSVDSDSISKDLAAAASARLGDHFSVLE